MVGNQEVHLHDLTQLPRLSLTPLRILTFGLTASAMARGWDLMRAPADSSVALTAISEWESPHAIGAILIVLAFISLFGQTMRSAPIKAVAHMALCAICLVMGAVSFVPIITAVNWGWRAPVTYIFGTAIVHWYIAHSWYGRWVVARGRRTVPDGPS